jgi:uncharacterized Zn finger protein (UPF0148 family)
MATTNCPACGLTVPYFCCEGLVCPACGYDEAVAPAREGPADEAADAPSPSPSSPRSSPCSMP